MFDATNFWLLLLVIFFVVLMLKHTDYGNHD
jgi:hypothetical protein